jgi:hypothetical protein
MSGQFHSSAALTPRKYLLVGIAFEIGWTPDLESYLLILLGIES